MTAFVHQTVLLDEAVVSVLAARDGVYVDATFGRGGHTRHLLSQLTASARVFGFDKDPQAIAAGEALAAEDARFSIVHESFAEILRVIFMVEHIDFLPHDIFEHQVIDLQPAFEARGGKGLPQVPGLHRQPLLGGAPVSCEKQRKSCDDEQEHDVGDGQYVDRERATRCEDRRPDLDGIGGDVRGL